MGFCCQKPVLQPRLVDICYANRVDRQTGALLYRLETSLSKFKELDWPRLMLPIKFCQFKMCQPAITDDTLNQREASRPMLCNHS